MLSAANRPKFSNFFKNNFTKIEIVVNGFNITMCIQMSTNKPSILPSVSEIALQFLEISHFATKIETRIQHIKVVHMVHIPNSINTFVIPFLRSNQPSRLYKASNTFAVLLTYIFDSIL